MRACGCLENRNEEEMEGRRADCTDDLREGVVDGEAGVDPTCVYRDIVTDHSAVCHSCQLYYPKDMIW